MSLDGTLTVGLSTLTLRPGRAGGTRSYLRGLVRAFSLDDATHRMRVLTNETASASVLSWAHGQVSVHVAESFHVIRARTRLCSFARAWAAPATVLRAVPDELDVMHFPLTVPLPRTTLPSVVTLHDVQHHDLPVFFSPAQRAWRRLTYDRAARVATLVITDTHHAKARIVECVGVPPERIVVSYLGIDDHFSSTPDEDDVRVLSDLSLPKDFILYPAALWPHKNHERLLEALTLMRRSDLALVLTGPALGRSEQVRRLAESRGLGGRVHYLGFVDDRVMPALYRRARAMVFPSLYEGFGTPPLEAMACGCPVAASAAGSLGEICGDAALAFDAWDPQSIAHAIERVTEDEVLRASLTKAGIRRSAGFTWADAAQEHANAYERAAQMGVSAPGRQAA